MIKRWIMLTEIPEIKYIRYTRSHNSGIFMVEICIFERSNGKYHFLETKICFHKKTTPQLSGHIGLQNIKVVNLGLLATVCLMHAHISS